MVVVDQELLRKSTVEVMDESKKYDIIAGGRRLDPIFPIFRPKYDNTKSAPIWYVSIPVGVCHSWFIPAGCTNFRSRPTTDRFRLQCVN